MNISSWQLLSESAKVMKGSVELVGTLKKGWFLSCRNRSIASKSRKNNTITLFCERSLWEYYLYFWVSQFWKGISSVVWGVNTGILIVNFYYALFCKAPQAGTLEKRHRNVLKSINIGKLEQVCVVRKTSPVWNGWRNGLCLAWRRKIEGRWEDYTALFA